MKRVFLPLLVLLFLLSLCGCNNYADKVPTTPTSPAENNTTAPTTDMPQQVTQQPMIAASLPILVQSYKENGDQLLLEHVYQNLELIVPDQDVADAIIIDFLNRTDKGHTSARSLYAEATQAQQSGDFTESYLAQITFTPMRLDQGVFSLMGASVTHKGYAHPEVTAESVTYDMATGNVLKFADILRPGTDTMLLKELILAVLDNTYLYEGYEDIVSDLLINPTNWYFSNNGLVFYYSPYEIAPYSSGVITAEIPYYQLAEILNDAYFPAESDITDGQLLTMMLKTEEMEQFSQIAELVCSDNGIPAVLYTKGMLKDIRIIQSRGNGEYTTFASPYITPGDAVVIYLSPNDTLKIQYYTNGELTEKTLSISSEGVPALTN